MSIQERFMEFIFSFGPKIMASILVIVVGHFAIKVILKIMNRTFLKLNIDYSLKRFFDKTVNIVAHVILVISVLSMLGVSTTGLIAALSAAAVAVSLALKDSLGNIAGGIMLLMSRPFITGDFVAVGDLMGRVKQIDMMQTTLITPDNRRIVVPNGIMMNEKIVNFSKEEQRRVDLVFSIAYNNDVSLAKDIIDKTATDHQLTTDKPEKVFVRVSNYGDSSVDITLRVWCNSPDYWTVHFDLLEQVRAEFDKQGISIPFNQLDVRLVDNK